MKGPGAIQSASTSCSRPSCTAPAARNPATRAMPAPGTSQGRDDRALAGSVASGRRTRRPGRLGEVRRPQRPTHQADEGAAAGHGMVSCFPGSWHLKPGYTTSGWRHVRIPQSRWCLLGDAMLLQGAGRAACSWPRLAAPVREDGIAPATTWRVRPLRACVVGPDIAAS